MMRKAIEHVEEEAQTERKLMKELRKIAEKHTLQYAILWYVYLRKPSLKNLHRIYSRLSGKFVRRNTVRKQLQQLERKGLIKKAGDRYVALVDPREVHDLFDTERSKAGRIGATIRHMKLTTKSLKISPGLRYYTEKTIEEAKKLIKKGKRATALDLICHTLLPLRENEILWLWHQDIFIYYIKKSRAGEFRAVRSKEISDLLKKLGFTPGIMIFHTLGHRESAKTIKKIFQRGPYSWPWARSISYGLKQLGLLQEVGTLYRIQLKRTGNNIELMLWNLYSNEFIAQYSISWNHKAPEPLRNKSHYVGTVFGRQHIKKEIEEDSYFSKWRY